LVSGKRSRILIAALAALLLLGGVAFAYDSSREDMVNDGVTVAGVDVGGLSTDEARAKIAAELGPSLERPVRVAVAGRRFKLTARRAHLVSDVEAMVQSALDRSRTGGLPARVWRGLTGGDVRAEVPAQVRYSRVAVQRFVRQVAKEVDRAPRNADVKLEIASLPAIPSQTGLKLNRARLRRSIESALTLPGAARSVRQRVRVVQPKVTTAELGKKYPAFITIDRPAFKLRFFKRLRLAKSYRIAVGQVGLETPAGLYHVQTKAVNPSWHVPESDWAGTLAGKIIPPGPENPIKARWMGIYNGAGIHGTDAISSLGTAASHGCIRMAIPEVEELYDKVPLQTPVFIQ
jgi:lipoprotein-anchoring transpeptidase ErfK/SrfK